MQIFLTGWQQEVLEGLGLLQWYVTYTVLEML